jgi:hypothetical protein
MEETCWGQTDLADILLEHLRCLLAGASCPLGVVVLRMPTVRFAPARTVDDDEEEGRDKEVE